LLLFRYDSGRKLLDTTS